MYIPITTNDKVLRLVCVVFWGLLAHLLIEINYSKFLYIPNGDNELDACIGVGSGTKILTDKSIYNHSVDDLLSRLDVEEEENCVLQPSEK